MPSKNNLVQQFLRRKRQSIPKGFQYS